MKKIIFILIIILILFAGGIAFAYFSNSPLLDRFLSSEMRQAREIQRIRKIFPDKLDEYLLYGRSPEKIRVSNECRNIEDHPDIDVGGLTGEVCQKIIIGEYRQTAGDRVVFIHLSQIVKGKDIFMALLKKSTQADKLGNYNIMRIERHELGWYPVSNFDVILTQEGTVESGSNGSENMSYKEMASGDNTVTQYFISKYPPEAAN